MLKRYIIASLKELVGLVAALVAAILAYLNYVRPALRICGAANNCFDTLWTTENIALLVAVCALIALNTYSVVRIWRQASREPIGYFWAEVAPLEQESDGPKIEYSLAQVRRTDGGGLEYRGVGRSTGSNELEFSWEARDAWAHPASPLHRFIFRTLPDDINLRRNAMPLDVSNIGFIDYTISKGRIAGRGSFFDFKMSGGKAERKHLRLSQVDHLLEKDAKDIIENFFHNPRELDRQRKVVEILSVVEKAFVKNRSPADIAAVVKEIIDQSTDGGASGAKD